MAWDFSTEPEFEKKLAWVREFVREEIYPLETLDLDHHTFRRLARPLQQQVKEQGLWAAHLGPELGGQGFGQVKLALLHEILGASDLAPFVFGNHAPDSGNAELLALAGTPEQKERWLYPLLEGELLSAYAMTEPGTGSDPKQLTTSARLEGDEWVINGHKWFVGNASRADFHIVMAVTEPEADPHHRMSMLIVPTSTPGIRMRELGNMHAPDGRHPLWSHCEVFYEDVRVPRENLLGGRGEGFVLAQKRLGPGRIHHAMRWLGVSRRAFDMLCERAVSVSVHGSRLADKQTIQNWVADCAAQMEAARLLTLQAAWRIDRYGASNARLDISMIKYFGAAVMHDVIDKALQVHGSLGFSTDMPLEQMYRWSRAARIYDGPDEVHRVTVAKLLLRRYQPVEVPTEHVPTRREAALRRFQAQLELLTENM
ncbi:acyl-CoA dehydrogenase [Thermobispora bispora]|jgi:acyl-CoA dehydrogenase|uniref:Acyl-CoA dehydrogenase domain protein n=1 Tax=Thermobispora bispora (strain ATCC 19993 / DSM 43833 / CBS 139.67 / JCM 10125 / KCTC 9307 / NBRC 14880 / R51) TaxID=469371 RepID=D6Y4P4_THEBD|nr:acyl-CoA dehydrogenase family protein [Thermobispora bispora]ADG89220.1 acyl-CoA dehydrogenase domain protein [Thermobispora bispora DSM 43833]MBO2475460.1 acyl-CoA dehydrogenase [Actinomycetales bacterium]MDI9581090.1 acyl-CoA dehydrogenase family protein [Thermobispora sp.]QSI48899.1 acyl-CoA dehydrogenase [Thermobispora bispora]